MASTNLQSSFVDSVAISSKEEPERLHLDYLDSLRGLCAMYVVLHHAVLSKNLHNPVGKILDFGIYAVEFFLILSGFCLMLPFVRRTGNQPYNMREFLVRRAWRILPTYYAALILSFVLARTILSEPTDATTWCFAVSDVPSFFSLLTHIFMIHDVFPAFKHNINYVLWSVAVEWRIYFLFFPLLFLWRTLGPFTTLLTTIVFSSAVAVILGRISPEHLTNMSAHYLGMFTMGMLGATICFSPAERWTKWRQVSPVVWHLVGLFAIVLLVFLSSSVLQKYAINRIFLIALDMWTALSGTIILLWISLTSKSAIWKFLHWKPLVEVGKFSYSLYLIHALVLQLTYIFIVRPIHLSPKPTAIALAIIGGALSVVAAYAFFCVAEKPFLQIGRKGFSKNNRMR